MVFHRSSVLLLAAPAVAAALSIDQTPAAPARPAPKAHSVSGSRMLAGKRGYLGVGLVDLTPERVKALKLKDDSGTEITTVEENSPAAKAGLKEHDVLLEVNGQRFDDKDDFVHLIGDSAPGSKVVLTIWREGARKTLTATLEARALQVFTFGGPNGDWVVPMPALPNATPGWEIMPMPATAPRVGFEGETLTPQLADFFGVKEGVLVRTVSERTAASKAGLKAGDVIIKVSGTPVSSTREISGIIGATRKNVTFTVMRNHREVTLNVEIARRQEQITSFRPEVL